MTAETPTIGAFAIIVTLDIVPGKLDEFMAHILKNAEAARRDEPGNLGFHVLKDTEVENRLHFFEQYVSAAALDDHRETPHYKAYAAGAGHLIAERSISKCDIVG